MEVFQIDKKIRMSQWDITKFQLIVHCYLNRIKMSDHDLSCLTLLGITGEQILEDFCQQTVDAKIFSSAQSARNAISKAEKKGLITKQGKNRKKIKLTLPIQAQGNILINYKVFSLTNIPELESQTS